MPGIAGTFHPNDSMLRGHGGLGGVAQYLASGRADFALVLDLADQVDARASSGSWVEVGAGYGRIIRSLIEVVPPEQVTAVDRLIEAVQFCRQEFGVHGITSNGSFDLAQSVTGDVVFAISVVSHLPRLGFEAFARMLGRTVRPGGLAIFSTHGRHSLDTIERYDDGAFVPFRDELCRRFDREGCAFTPYGNEPQNDYGMAWHRPDLVESLVGTMSGNELVLVDHVLDGVAGHQDLYAFQRRVAREGTPAC